MTDYSFVTEQPGAKVTPEALRMVHTRYHVAAESSVDKDVLELAAGVGFGIGWMQQRARRIVATDVMPHLMRRARRTYGARAELAVSNATSLPFASQTFDLVLIFEAIYYLDDVAAFFREANRVLRPQGTLLISTANRSRPGFVRSPHSRTYYSSAELRSLCEEHGFSTPKVWGAFPAKPLGWKQKAILEGFQLADRIGMIPRTLRGRARMKRILYGPLVDLPPELQPHAQEAEPLVPLKGEDDSQWKVLFAESRKVGRS